MKRSIFILTGHWSNCDQEGSASRSRPSLHQTEVEACVFPRTWVHGVQFLLVGQTCVRARWPSNRKKKVLHALAILKGLSLYLSFVTCTKRPLQEGQQNELSIIEIFLKSVKSQVKSVFFESGCFNNGFIDT